MLQTLTTFLLATVMTLALVPVPRMQKKPAPSQAEKTECGARFSPAQIQSELARKTRSALTLAATPNPNTPLYLPLTLHMVRDTEGVQVGLASEDLAASLQTLNQMWKQVGIQFFIYGDIDYSIRNDDFYFLPNIETSQDALRRVNNVPNTINVYFTNLKGNLSGTATFTSENTQAILLNYGNFSEYTPNLYRREVFAHEMGHYFDLYHTHETDFGVECPTRGAGRNCARAGDGLCDTPADPGLNGTVDYDCSYVSTAPLPTSCDSTPYTPPIHNLMSVARIPCRTEFTPQQINKVWQTLNNAANRTPLIESGKRYVDPLASDFPTECTSKAPCRTIERAVAMAGKGSLIFLKPSYYFRPSISKAVMLMRWGTTGVIEFK